MLADTVIGNVPQSYKVGFANIVSVLAVIPEDVSNPEISGEMSN